METRAETRAETRPETTQTNVDYLLEKFTISEIIDIQNKLKTDVDRKKQELKQLVGERYGDLMEAVDTIKQMNDSVDNVLKSLVSLNNSQTKHFLTQNKSSFDKFNDLNGKQNENNCNLAKNYKIGLILKLVIEMPLNIWSALENEDLLTATYNYSFGRHLCSKFEQLVSAKERPNLLRQYETAINRFNEVIVQKCWTFHQKSSLTDNFDDSLNADIFCCLVLLRDFTPKQLFLEVLEKRKSDIRECFVGPHELRDNLKSFINLLLNTIKCIHSVFYKSNGTKAKTLLHQRYERMTKISFDSSLIGRKKLSQELKASLTDFRIKSKTIFDVLETELIRSETKNWISLIKVLIEPILRQTFESIGSANHICVVLNEINAYLKLNHKLNDWEEYCEDLMANYLSIWDHFVINSVISRIKSIISENIDKTVVSLKENINNSIAMNDRLKYEDLEVIAFIWSQSENNSSNLMKRAFAQIPIIDSFCSHFDDSLKDLLNDIKIIKDFNFKLIKSKELEQIEWHLVNECHAMINKMKEFLDSMDVSEERGIATLFCAQFLRQLTQSCPHLMQCFESSSHNTQYSWTKTKDLLLSYSYNSYKKVFDFEIKRLFSSISSESMTDLKDFITNALVWDKIQTKEESEEGKVVTSKIEVPLQVSAFLYNNLNKLCIEVNRVAGHTVPRPVILNILSSLTQELVRIYGSANECLSTKDYPQTIKQTIALQLYFDLLFIKQLLSTTRDESIKSNQIVPIQQLLHKFQLLIDPFDLHVFYSHIQTNIAKLGKTTTVLFGLLVPDNTLVASDPKSKQSNQMNEIHNIMAFNSCSKPLTLLNINSISSKVSRND